jgi:ribosome-associated protein
VKRPRAAKVAPAAAAANALRDAARRFAIAAAALAADTRCVNVVVLELAGISPLTDFFVLATGSSPRQMRSVADEIDELALKHGYRSLYRSGYEGETWIAVDYVDVVLHLFNAEARAYYDLDNLWGDGEKIAWQESVKPAR